MVWATKDVSENDYLSCEQKLIKRLVYAEHHHLLVTRQEELLDELKELAESGFEQAHAEWERNVINWSA